MRDLSFLKMREDLVTEQKARFAANNGAAEIMHLPKGASERCFAALIGTSDDKKAFCASKFEVVGHDLRLFGNEFVGKGQVVSRSWKRFFVIPNNKPSILYQHTISDLGQTPLQFLRIVEQLLEVSRLDMTL